MERIWSLAAFYAYRAYRDQNLLNMAVSVWNATNEYLVSPEDASNGTHPMRNNTILSTCKGGKYSLPAGDVMPRNWYSHLSQRCVDQQLCCKSECVVCAVANANEQPFHRPQHRFLIVVVRHFPVLKLNPTKRWDTSSLSVFHCPPLLFIRLARHKMCSFNGHPHGLCCEIQGPFEAPSRNTSLMLPPCYLWFTTHRLFRPSQCFRYSCISNCDHFVGWPWLGLILINIQECKRVSGTAGLIPPFTFFFFVHNVSSSSPSYPSCFFSCLFSCFCPEQHNPFTMESKSAKWILD